MNCTGSTYQGIYNCYGTIDNSLCYSCKYNSDSEKLSGHKNQKDNFVSMTEKMQVLYDYLRGIKLPEGVHCKMPKLSAHRAFSVIWFLQEVMHCLPDNIEQCQCCKLLFDSESEGYRLDDQYKLNGRPLPKKYWGHWCEDCVPNVDFQLG